MAALKDPTTSTSKLLMHLPPNPTLPSTIMPMAIRVVNTMRILELDLHGSILILIANKQEGTGMTRGRGKRAVQHTHTAGSMEAGASKEVEGSLHSSITRDQ